MDGRAESRRDRSGICICLAVIGITLFYADQVWEKEWIFVSAGVSLILFIFLVLSVEFGCIPALFRQERERKLYFLSSKISGKL